MPPLLEWVCDEMELRPPKDTIEALAAADYGEDFEENLAAIKQILAGDRRPLRPLRYPLREVLELCRWRRPDPDDRANNLIGLFASLVLLIAERDPLNTEEAPLDVFDNTLIMTVEMVTRAFPGHIPKLVAMLDPLAAAPSDNDEAEPAFVEIARFLLLEASGGGAPSLLAALAAATAWIERAYADPDWRWGDERTAEGRYAWLFGVRWGSFKDERWRELLDAALGRLRVEMSEVATALDAFATRER